MDFATFCHRSRFGEDIRSFISVGRFWRQKTGWKSELWRHNDQEADLRGPEVLQEALKGCKAIC